MLIAILISFAAGFLANHLFNSYKMLKGMSHMGTLLELELCLFVMRMMTKLIDKNVKHTNSMEEKGYDKEQIKIIKNENEHDLHKWKKSVVSAFIEYYPKNLVRRYDIQSFEDITKLGFEYYLYKEGDNLVNQDEQQDTNPRTD
jgi:hypothetical protein